MKLTIIGGEFRSRRLFTAGKMRPTTGRVREAVFNICQHSIRGAHFLDLFAGSGAMGLEALSRGAMHVTFVESHKISLQALSKNIETLQVHDRVTVIPRDVFVALPFLIKKGTSFDVIYVDPPYGEVAEDKLLSLFDEGSLLALEGQLFLEDAARRSSVTSSLKTLQLQSERLMGITLLRHYCKPLIP